MRPDAGAVYFAHPVSTYGSEIEPRIVADLEAQGLTVLNPNGPEHEAAYRAQGMAYFQYLVSGCDSLVHLPYPDGAVGAGVAREVLEAIGLAAVAGRRRQRAETRARTRTAKEIAHEPA